jgi:uncharacterized protein YbjT (DUF2867 family)
MNIVVTGATGYVGGRLTPRLLAAGQRVICLTRDPARLAGRSWEGVETRRGNALEPATLRSALHGADVAYYLIHSMAEGAHGFEDRDRIAATNFGAAARAAGVQRIVYLGGLGQRDEVLSPHLASRHEVGDILRASQVPVTEFRAGVVVGSGSMSFEMIRYLTERLPVMITPKWVGTLCQPIAIDDVLEYLVRCLDVPASIGRTFDIGGPDVLTYGDMMRAYADVRGLKRILVPVPVLTPRLSSYWVDLVTPLPASYSHPLIEGLRSEVVVADGAAHDLFHFPLTPYKQAIRRALERTLSGEVETFWATAAGSEAPATANEFSDREGLFVDRRTLETRASARMLFAAFAGIGGRRGWYYADWLWRLRGLLDRLVGGIGLRRGRRRPDDLLPGDALDSWRVEAVERNRLVRLRAEMKLPGRAWLQFEAVPEPSGDATLVQTAFFEPRGLAGWVYWYLLYPIHQFIFAGMSRAIARRAQVPEQSERLDGTGGSGPRQQTDMRSAGPAG